MKPTEKPFFVVDYSGSEPDTLHDSQQYLVMRFGVGKIGTALIDFVGRRAIAFVKEGTTIPFNDEAIIAVLAFEDKQAADSVRESLQRLFETH